MAAQSAVTGGRKFLGPLMSFTPTSGGRIGKLAGRPRCRSFHSMRRCGNGGAVVANARSTSHGPGVANGGFKRALLLAPSWPSYRRYAHGQTPSESEEAQQPAAANSDASKTMKSFELWETPSSSDPTAKRPTKKCDPYGLAGESLSRDKCTELMSTLDDGWVLLESPHEMDDGIMDALANGGWVESPKFLQRQYRHRTFHEASRFLNHVSLVATNLNHYPFLSMERILVDDLNNMPGDGEAGTGDDAVNDNVPTTTDATTAPKKGKRQRKVKGWAFQSTVRCSTYRPPTTAASASRTDSDHDDAGLTYHDFHLAMSVDVEAMRGEVKRLLWL